MWRTRLTQDFLIGSDEGTKRTSALSPCPETNLASQVWAKASAPQNSRLWLLGSQLFPWAVVISPRELCLRYATFSLPTWSDLALP